jgi:NAD-dependent SIR2 family protein deacetylase
MKKQGSIYFYCNKCGKQQEPNKEKSNENWEVYDNVPCKCGGQFKPKVALKNG